MEDNKNKIVDLIVDDVVKSDGDLNQYLLSINAKLIDKFNEYNKRSELTRLYKADATILREASKKTGLPMVQLMSYAIRDAFLGKRDFNKYMDELVLEINHIKQWILKK